MNIIQTNEFIEWAFSDLLTNSLRGMLAEYIVGKSIGALDKKRVEWDAYDLEMKDGIKIEVKSSAYLQTWNKEGEKYSTISFGIGKKKGWNSKTNKSLVKPDRSADIYVFCVYEEKDRESANPLDLEKWSFFVCSREHLNVKFGDQKTVRKRLKSHKFANLRSINRIIAA